jgi:hypothetical protein
MNIHETRIQAAEMKFFEEWPGTWPEQYTDQEK